MKTVLSVCSARPNFVKLAALHHAIEETCRGDFNHLIVHTGQHYDPLFSDVFFSELTIPKPDFNLGVRGGGHDEVISATQAAFEEVLPKVQPDIVLVYGDVNGAVGAARAAKGAGFMLGHVEAGLRSFDLSMPEEQNRIAVDKLADLLFCSESAGLGNLVREKAKGEAHLVGNTMIDTLIRMMPGIEQAAMEQDLPPSYAVATLHRPSNVDDPAMLRLNVEVLCELSSRIPLVLPLHHRFKAALEEHGLLSKLRDSVNLLPAQPYLSFLRLVKGAAFVLTDSGGIQEETTFLQKRCWTLRKNTERPATIESGSNVLIDLTNQDDRKRLMQAAVDETPPEIVVPPLWDGKAGERIVNLIEESL